MGNALRELMDKDRLSYGVLGFLTGYSRGFLCQIANDKRQPSPEAALKIAKALKVSPLRLWK